MSSTISKVAIYLVISQVSLAASAHNLLQNGNFESGNSGFSSQYQFEEEGQAEGTYCITTSPRLCNSAGADFGDHTTGTGLMMVVNGSPVQHSIVWSEAVPVIEGQAYTFSGWTASWSNNGNSSVQARLKVLVDHGIVGRIRVTKANGHWHRFSIDLTATKSGDATISLIDTDIDRIGNDFALDDLHFQEAADE